MPRGRPKQDKTENYPICQRCNKKSPVPLNRINTHIITGKVHYHRNSPEILNLCNNCCNELSEIVDVWFLKFGEPKPYCMKKG